MKGVESNEYENTKTIVSVSMTRKLLKRIDKEPLAKANRSLWIENNLRKTFGMQELKK